MTSKIDYDEVLFEIKDATEYATLHADAFRAAMRERDMLRAEREVWANIAQERNDLRAEVERLRAEVVRLVSAARLLALRSDSVSKQAIKIQGFASGEPSRFDDEYVVSLDFWNCGPGECNLITTLDPAQAMQFDDAMAALEFWKTVDPRQPVRTDGKPNRPLTAFSVTVEPLGNAKK